MALRVHDDIAGLRASVADRRTRGPIGFVPTMGALHAGHASLIARARRECETVVVSIFVNPLQFDRAEDLARYPRPLDDDVALCEGLGVDFVFAPAPDVMYPSQPQCTVSVGQMADHLCGAFRPGHFAGVATVVVKLLNIVQPDVAYFGEKDAQQLAIVRRAVADLNVPVTIASVETVREPDGLAISSRNRHLSSDERRLAPLLYQALRAVQRPGGRGHNRRRRWRSRARPPRSRRTAGCASSTSNSWTPPASSQSAALPGPSSPPAPYGSAAPG